MSALEIRTPPAWAPKPTDEDGLLAFVRESTGKGERNPVVLVRVAPWHRPVGELSQVAPAELRAQLDAKVDVLNEEWPETKPGGYPSMNQILLAHPPTTGGRRGPLLVCVVHILMHDTADPARQRLLQAQLRCEPGDREEAVPEFEEIVAHITVSPDTE